METAIDRSSCFLLHTKSNEKLDQLKQDINKRMKKIQGRLKPSSIYSIQDMLLAGFRYTGDGDTVHCDQCHLEVAGWTEDMVPNIVHAERNPNCPFVCSKLLNSFLKSNNEKNPRKRQKTESYWHQFKSNLKLSEVNKLKQIRRRTFSHWSHEIKPSAEQMINAGFFACNVGDRVICLYCNLICQQWKADIDDPSEVHKTLSPICPYVLSILQDHNETNPSEERRENDNLYISNQFQLQFNDSNILSRFVAARLDLSSSQNLLDQNFKLSVIKRCWEDQLQLKQDDFISDADLLIACTILQKQIDHIKGNKDNIIIPSVQMKRILETNQSDSSTHSNNDKMDISQNQLVSETSKIKSTTTNKNDSTMPEKDATKISSIINPCIICHGDEKQLACIPCGHLTTCLSCSRTLRTCPTCRRHIEAFVRVYI
ncbi:unnamed protein product [Rotaria sp. Silwood2]|nr:unnamed protein product [Rotaria sp. Silwood2]